MKTKLLLALVVSTAFFWMGGIPAAFAADPVGPQTPVGPIGTVGPVAPVGPQSPVGPVGAVGPIPGTVGPDASPTPTPSPSPATVVSTDPLTTQQVSSSGSSSSADSNNTTNTNLNDQSSRTATINNSTQQNLDNGHGTVSNNTQVGNTSTGDINSATTFINVANSNLGAGSSYGSSSQNAGNSGSIVLTSPTNQTALVGSGSNSTADTNNTNTTTGVVGDTRSVNTTNNLQIQATTGLNTFQSNGAEGNVKTGDTNIDANVLDLSNLNTGSQVNVNDYSVLSSNPNATIVVPASQNTADTTGPNSSDSSQNTTNNQQNVQVSDAASANDTVTVNAQTGGDTVANNTAVGSITPGAVNVNTKDITIANATVPQLYIVNVIGDTPWSGTLVDSNNVAIPSDQIIILHSGPSSTATGSNTTTNSLSESQNYTANEHTNLLVDATTGGNKVLNNTLFGNLTDGSVNVYARFIHLLNVNASQLGINLINLFLSSPSTSSTTPNQATTASVPTTQTVVSNGQPVTASAGATHSSLAPTSHTVTPSSSSSGHAATGSGTAPTFFLRYVPGYTYLTSARLTSVPNSLYPLELMSLRDGEVYVTGSAARQASPFVAFAASANGQEPEVNSGGMAGWGIAGGGIAMWMLFELASYIAGRRHA